eukprot:CAMPEP_0203717688 /NCGR_PEP_ID=MMETSP0092-20131115/2146_1 /ASSEMBLY_ACC=CAM_ASM_001090 /TAXON_ID=426623 /ORGANISM="Chaetoceros affinis, Strain CCMP159" /LENGTH=220 /DNA_ID=CAMNT_0050596629 /DNA_START=52 /DNA_END=714 /DNA_ORIENTATION=-
MKSILFSVTLLLSAFLSVDAFSSTIHGTTVRKTALFSTTEEKTDAAPKPTTENQQPKYGNELALPDTYVRCGRCATSFALTDDDLGEGKGRRVECSVCGHSWFQSRDRLFNLNEGRELVPLPQFELDRITKNIEKGRDPDFTGDTKFFVGNLDFEVREADLWELFGEVGDVGEVSLVTGPDGRSRGFAFVTMMEQEVTDKCLELDSTEVKGRAINVKLPN